MRTVIQRVTNASVTIEQQTISRINAGLLILVAIEDRDTQDDIDYLTKKIANLRIFNDDEGVMNRSILQQSDCDILVVSQFTLMASCQKGNRPSYIRASRPDFAIPMYNAFVAKLQDITHKPILTGRFGADMQVALTNDGPVTIIIDSHLREF